MRQAVVICPEELWQNPEYVNPFWHVAFHVLFYTHLYLQPAEEDFIPWEKHRDFLVSLKRPEDEAERIEPYTKEEILAYHMLCLEQVELQVDSLELEAESGFDWLRQI